jgi:hypothetical protein
LHSYSTGMRLSESAIYKKTLGGVQQSYILK